VQWLPQYNSNGSATERNDGHAIKKLLHNKKKFLNGKAVHRMGENVCQLYI
jgi:hypothetical protein